MRSALDWVAVAGEGGVGTSSKTRADSGKGRRTATSAPPAETFTAVASSSESLPFRSWLRTKIGIAKGKRGHCRRSDCRSSRLKQVPHYQVCSVCPHLGGQTQNEP